jgi:GntR family transcriptional regulator, transcriptional repressor for pyruvate dehydrogenase complex
MTDLKLPPRLKERLADQVYGQILEQIVSGAIREGEKLPTEKEISQSFKVSRPVVREALMQLQADGLVVARQGSGTYVQHRPPQGLIRFEDASAIAGLLRCYEIRMALEGEAAALAASRHSPQQLHRIKATLDALRTAFDARDLANEADFAFHRAIAEASCNELFVHVLETIQNTIERSMMLALSITREGSQERAKRVFDEHQRIYEAIALGDAEGATLAMRSHLIRARQRVTDHERDA